MHFPLKLKQNFQRIPLQIWVIFAGSLIFSIGSSMAWPFLNIYLRERLNLPLRTTTLLISLRAVTGILASFIAGTICDKFGRRGVMLASLLGGTVYYFLMVYAQTIWQFAILMGIWGAMDLFYPIGSNSMIADMVKAEDRLEVYSLMRMVNNAGIAIGPIFGGILAIKSYSLIFYSASIGYFISFVIFLFTVKETLQKRTITGNEVKIPTKGYHDVLKDGVFVSTILMAVFIYMGSSIVFNLLSLYASETYGILESQISYVFTVNALMCVFLQLGAMKFTVRIHPMLVMVISSLFYTVGLLLYVVCANVIWYCICMGILTIGELLMSPTMLALTAKRAPADARGRYMSIYNLSHPIGNAFGPALAGLLYDQFIPQSIWYSAGFYCLIAAIGFSVLYRKNKDASWLQKISIDE